MNELKELSGPWCGFWIQAQLRYHMRLRLQFVGGRLIGGGSDCAGDSEIQGALDEQGTVVFCKSYPTHVVHYEGRWDGLMISGLWTMRHPVLYGRAQFLEERGEFEIWPEADESLSISELVSATEVRALTA